MAEETEAAAAGEAAGAETEEEAEETVEEEGGPEGHRRLRLDGDEVHLWSVFILMIIGAAMRIAYVAQPMHYMESLTYIAFSSRPLSVGLSYYTWPNNQLLNTLLSHLSSSLLGNEPWAIRLPALIFGILLLPAVYLVGRKLYNKHAGLLALALAVPASQLIGFSTQARGYTMQAFFFLTLILCAVSLLEAGALLGLGGLRPLGRPGLLCRPHHALLLPAGLHLAGLVRAARGLAGREEGLRLAMRAGRDGNGGPGVPDLPAGHPQHRPLLHHLQPVRDFAGDWVVHHRAAR